MIPPRIKKVEVLDDFVLKITYINNMEKLYDFKKNLTFHFYQKLNNPEYFKKAKSAETTIEWPDGEDIDPNELYENSIFLKN